MKPRSDPKDLMVLEELTLNAKQIQDDVLEEILTLNANTEYLRGFLHGSSDKELFKKNVPVVSYDDLRPYIERVANGEPSDVISGKPITQFILSSGTSGGKQKIFPVNNKFFEDMTFLISLPSFIISKHIKNIQQGKTLSFLFARRKSTTPCDNKQAMYCHFLCGLFQRDQVVSVAASFGSGLVGAITFLEKHWKEMCGNIRSGHVNLIEEECREKSWKEYYGNKVPLISPLYTSSETMFGVNMDPLCKPEDVSYTFMPNMSYFEFLPAEEGNEGIIVDLVNVKLGGYYEPLITNYFGLHRYRMGDILQVSGFYNNAPQFRFVRRKNMVLSITVEVTTEEDILKALNNATLILKSSNLVLMEFTCYADVSTIPGESLVILEDNVLARFFSDKPPLF
ncbi:hypothetical protein AALP_AA1G164600 [Arabis alpina]|uniref:GH3 middle domain-containing protein n=1 Tax=Arabis alpina TaxID=50452 RepID=A0A087HNM4_ARAAL|nr:hypothetical protein AALP_AA1G164600 [Arabis alpina]